MATAEQMKLVFRLGQIRFSLPVDHLVEIRQGSAGGIDRTCQDLTGGQLGSIHHQDGQLGVYDLSYYLQLPPWSGSGEIDLLVLSGSDGPWAVPVDEVVGIFPNEAFSPLTTAPLLTHICKGEGVACEQWQDTLLFCGDAGQWERLRG
ncbi:MAG TPA: chemotaxis protein CheW [Geothermobacteraceae bacterium]|nr:chemotaxis protein CheW [Geothermobacteraceae bacterium]